MTARREAVTSPSGRAVRLDVVPDHQHAVVRVPVRLHRGARRSCRRERGFWPAFWTWQAPGVDRYIETDVYEFYSRRPAPPRPHPALRARGAAASRTPAVRPDRRAGTPTARRSSRPAPPGTSTASRSAARRRPSDGVDQHHLEPRGVREDPAGGRAPRARSSGSTTSGPGTPASHQPQHEQAEQGARGVRDQVVDVDRAVAAQGHPEHELGQLDARRSRTTPSTARRRIESNRGHSSGTSTPSGTNITTLSTKLSGGTSNGIQLRSPTTTARPSATPRVAPGSGRPSWR